MISEENKKLLQEVTTQLKPKKKKLNIEITLKKFQDIVDGFSKIYEFFTTNEQKISRLFNFLLNLLNKF